MEFDKKNKNKNKKQKTKQNKKQNKTKNNRLAYRVHPLNLKCYNQP